MIKYQRIFRSFSSWRNHKTFSIEKFLEDKSDFKISDEMLEIYVNKAAKMSLLKFESEDEKQQVSNDFRSALIFTNKLSDVDIKPDCEPLENVLDFYGGNQDKMRMISDEMHDGSNVKMMKAMNSNMRGNLCVAPKAFTKESEE